MHDITACIVLFKNDRNMLLKAIKSFLDTNLSVKLYLVDNSPVDHLKNIINDQRVSYIFNPANPGFGSAHNIVINKIIGLSKYHLVLNPDIYFENGTLESIFSFMENNVEYGHLMPKILYPNGDLQYLCKQNPSISMLFFRRFFPSFFKLFLKEEAIKYEFRDYNYNSIITNVPYFSGCFMFFRTPLFERVGLFDERIFMYIEDADITRRFLTVSNNIYYPFATVYHHFQKGSHKNFKLTWYSIKGALVYFYKWGIKL